MSVTSMHVILRPLWRSLFISLLILVSIDGFRMLKPRDFPSSFPIYASTDIDISTSKLEVKPFLKVVLSSRSTENEKKVVLEQLQSLRSRESPRSSSADANDLYAVFLDNIVSEVNTVENNKWAMFRWPIPLPSYRVKLASLLRLFNSVLSEDMKEENLNRGNELALKRRTIAVLLNQLRTTKGVRALEKEANSLFTTNTMKDMLLRTPDLETPIYDVIAQKTGWEVREYKPFSVCSYLMSEEEAKGPAAFNRLAGYIFGGNQPNKKMAMTTPVIFTEDEYSDTDIETNIKSNKRKMSFVMPSDYWSSPKSLSQAPPPLADSGVSLEVDGGGLIQDSNTIAVRWFGGYATRNVTSKRIKQLLEEVERDTDWDVMDGQKPYCMQYNDPFQPPWKRRNEVAVPVKRALIHK